MGLYNTEAEIADIVRGFELCTTSKDGFPHSSHLTVAVWYFRQADLSGATEMIRNGLKRFLKHHDVEEGKYNETITIFWLRMVGKVLEEEKLQQTSLPESANAVLQVLHDSGLVFEYYSRERLYSEEARRGWLEPDMKPL